MANTAPNLSPLELEYFKALVRADTIGRTFVKNLPSGKESRSAALSELPVEFEDLDKKRQRVLAQRSLPGEDGFESDFLEAAGAMRTGHILVVSAEAAYAEGDVPDVTRGKVTEAFHTLAVDERQMNGEPIRSLNFKPSLTQTIKASATAAEALQVFKDRAVETLDNMVSDAYDLLAGVVKEFKEDFNKFAKDLGELAKSFTSDLTEGVMKVGLEKIISGLKSLAEILKSEALSEAVDAVRDAIAGGLKGALADAYKCDYTKQKIGDLALTGDMTVERLDAASNSMAEMSLRYVGLLRLAKRILAAIGVGGALLSLSGAFAAHAALVVPIAYAVVFVATLLIGTDFARSKMNLLIATI